MVFVKGVPTVPVPNVYALFTTRHKKHKKPTSHIVMESVDGNCLGSCWASMDREAKLAVSE